MKSSGKVHSFPLHTSSTNQAAVCCPSYNNCVTVNIFQKNFNKNISSESYFPNCLLPKLCLLLSLSTLWPSQKISVFYNNCYYSFCSLTCLWTRLTRFFSIYETGNRGTGNRGTGNKRTGNRTSGNRRTGNKMAGNRRTGSRRTGNMRSGKKRTGN